MEMRNGQRECRNRRVHSCFVHDLLSARLTLPFPPPLKRRMLYINGPYFINPHDLSLIPNAGSWNRLYGMLFVDQPMGVGFSAINSPADIPKVRQGVRHLGARLDA